MSTVKADAVQFGEDPQALIIADVAGTNGRRLSIQPVDQGNSTASAQVEIVPGANVDPAQVTAQILIYNKTGENFERFVTSAYAGEYQFHSSRRGTGKARPTFFYVDNQPVTAWMPDASFLVYKGLEAKGGLGVNGKTPAAQAVLPPPATDTKSALALVNAIREALIATGIAR